MGDGHCRGTPSRTLGFTIGSGSPSRGISTSILTRTISFPPFAKNARSSARKKPLVGPANMLTGGAGGKSAMSSWPVGGAGHFRAAELLFVERSTSGDGDEHTCLFTRRSVTYLAETMAITVGAAEGRLLSAATTCQRAGDGRGVVEVCGRWRWRCLGLVRTRCPRARLV